MGPLPQIRQNRTQEVAQNTHKRAAASRDAGLVALVGGQHNSVIERRAALCYCMLINRVSAAASYCEDCPFRKERL